MEALTLKAVAASTTDQGIFEAVISTQSVDREKDIVSADGMVAALRKWNRPIPLAWNHSTSAEDQIGYIDPQSVRAVDGEVVAGGKVDIESAVGEEAWRSFKSRTIGFSFGYLIVKSTPRQGGGKDISELDVFEVTATPTPMNNDTRVLSAKALMEGVFAPDELQGAASGELKAVWTAAYINDLPDSSFLYIEDGGTKDDQGKTTPRSLRHFPYKDASGAVDLPHLRNALARIPQSNLPQAVKDRLTTEAQAILDRQKSAVSEDARGKDRFAGTPEAQDPLRQRSRKASLDVLSDGLSLREPPSPAAPPKAPPSRRELKARSRELMLDILSGGLHDQE